MIDLLLTAFLVFDPSTGALMEGVIVEEWKAAASCPVVGMDQRNPHRLSTPFGP
jgi:hypothetical protein